MNNRALAFVKEKYLTFMPKFTVEINGNKIADISRKFFVPKYYIKGLEWNIELDLFSRDYFITDGHKTIASIHNQQKIFSDVFEINILDDYNEIVALAVVLAICAVSNVPDNR